MKFQLKNRLYGFFIFIWMVLASRTLRYTIEGREHFEPLYKSDKGFITSAWHGRILMLSALHSQIGRKLPKRALKNCILSSNSKDGEVMATMGNWVGLEVVRGSAANPNKRKDKGGLLAIIKGGKLLRKGHMFLITPDGPLGPNEQIKEGLLVLAERGRAPIVPFAVSCSGGPRLDTWDRFFLPLPFSRGALVFGPPISLNPEGYDAADMEKVQAAMDAVTKRADEIVGR